MAPPVFRTCVLAGLILGGLACRAEAEAAPSLTSVVFVRGVAQPADDAAPVPTLAYARRDAGRSDFPRTAVSRKVASGATGSVGYLCGIKPFAPDYYGASGGPASGWERGLTFLGVKLDYVFH